MRVKSWERGQKSLIWGGKIIFTHLERTKQREREKDEYSGPWCSEIWSWISGYPVLLSRICTPSYFCASFSFLSWCSTKSRMFKVPFEHTAKPACFVRQSFGFAVCGYSWFVPRLDKRVCDGLLVLWETVWLVLKWREKKPVRNKQISKNTDSSYFHLIVFKGWLISPIVLYVMTQAKWKI